jgi:isoleucyl-tRNA synthetase
MIPFMAEEIYRNLVCSVDANAPESVHLCSFPEVKSELIDPDLEYSMDQVLNVVVLGRAARNGSNIKNRQPLSELIVCSENELGDEFCQIIKEELNVKAVSFSKSVDELVSYSFKPNLKTVGPKYGKLLNGIRTALSECDGSATKKTLDTEGKIVLAINGENAELVADDLLIETKQKDGYFTLTDNGFTVTLNTSLTEELIEEGYLREIVSKLQTMRKEAGFDVTDHIKVALVGNELLKALFEKNSAEVCADVLCDSYSFEALSGYEKQWDINGEKVTLSVEKI